MKRETIDPETISDTQVVDYCLTTFSTKKREMFLWNVELPFHRYVEFIDALIDNKFTNIRNISMSEFTDRVENNPRVPQTVVRVNNYKSIIKMMSSNG